MKTVLLEIADWLLELVALVALALAAWYLLPAQIAPWATAAVIVIWGGMWVWASVLMVRYLIRGIRERRTADLSSEEERS